MFQLDQWELKLDITKCDIKLGWNPKTAVGFNRTRCDNVIQRAAHKDILIIHRRKPGRAKASEAKTNKTSPRKARATSIGKLGIRYILMKRNCQCLK